MTDASRPATLAVRLAAAGAAALDEAARKQCSGAIENARQIAAREKSEANIRAMTAAARMAREDENQMNLFEGTEE